MITNRNADPVIIQSTMTANNNAPPKKGKLKALRSENAELKQRLLRLQETHQGLQQDVNFHKIKVAELTEILMLRGEQDPISQKLMEKSLQSAELSMEVDQLKRKLYNSTALLQKLEEEREDRKRLLLELSGIVKTLQTVQVDYAPTAPTAPQNTVSPTTMSIQNVKRKVETIMEDRRMLVARCMELEKEGVAKEEKITALEAQFHLLNSMNIVKGEGQETERDSSSISRTLSSVSAETEQNSIDVDVIRCKKKAGGATDYASCISEFTSPVSDSSAVSSSQMQLQASFDEPTTNVERLQHELEEANQRYQQFKEICQRAFSKMKFVENELATVQHKYEEAASQRDALRFNLKEVIEQYKELNLEHDKLNRNFEDAQLKSKYLEQKVEEFETARREIERRGAEILKETSKGTDVNRLVAAYSQSVETIAALRKRVAASSKAAEEAEKKKDSGSLKFRDSVAQCQKLQTEKEAMKKRVSEIEEQLQVAKKEAQKHKEEARHTRRRLTAYMRKDGKVEQEMEVGKLFPNQNSKLPVSAQRRLLLVEARTAGKAWNQKYQVAKERDNLATENKDLKVFCEELMNDILAKE